MRFSLLVVTLLVCSFVGFAQQAPQTDKVLFFNVENLFDPIDDPHTQDNDFTPSGKYAWTWKKLAAKNNGITKIILAAGNGDAPVLVGLSEVENRIALNKLTQETPLAKISYDIVHRDSPDPRGIDVALLYRTDRFKVLNAAWYKVCYDSKSCATREILYARGVLRELDTLHIFVNHWPSKLGGAAQSEPKRVRAAETLRAVTDSILLTNPHANIIVMGDFNDTPDSKPVVNALGAVENAECLACLHNLMLPLARRGEGSLKYRKNWELIDMFFVSGNLLDNRQPVSVSPSNVQIFRAPFLLEPDEKYLGEKVRRTHEGLRYKGGVSDHLPIVMTITYNY